MKRFILSFFVMVFCPMMLFAQRIAVLDFNAGSGVSQADVDGVSAIFNTYFSPKGYTLVERTLIDRVIDEQNFQRGKYTEDQMVKVGAILNVSKIVVGDVNVVMNQYNVDVRVINVQSGTIAAKDGVTWSQNSSYRDMMKELAARLAGKIAITPVQDEGPSPSSNAGQREKVVTVLDYLKIFPYELGTFNNVPTAVISQLNKQGKYGYNSWRIPTSEEISLLKGLGFASDKKYMTQENGSGIVLLVTEKEGVNTGGTQSQGSDYVENTAGLNMKMVYVGGGTFQMGATSEQGSDAYNHEKPVRSVRLDSYYIGACEVTQAQWEKVMGTSIHQQASKIDKPAMYGVGPDYPMYYVSWDEAQAFCRELSRMTGKTYVLSTEAQWEYAARGGNKKEGTKYSGSWSIDAVAWYDGNSGGGTHPVGSKRANALGIHDMSGNVWEWCSDWNGTYQSSDIENPTGPSLGSNRVRRGGSWFDYAIDCRVSRRGISTPGIRGGNLGFRVVCLP